MATETTPAPTTLKTFIVGQGPCSFTVRRVWGGDVLASGRGFATRREAQIQADLEAEALGCTNAAYTNQLRAGGWTGV